MFRISINRISNKPSPTVANISCEISEWDPAYTDNDALCPFCRCLVDQHAVCDGSLITHEYEVGEEGESRTTRDPITGEARLDLWPEKTEYWNRSVFTEIEVTDDRDRLMASIFHSTCPLCQEFLRCRRTTIGGILEQNPTVKHITIVRLLRLSPPGLPKYCAAILHARYNKGDAYDPRRELVSMFKLITEKRRWLHYQHEINGPKTYACTMYRPRFRPAITHF